MKKLLLLSALFIFACSSDDEGNNCIYVSNSVTNAVNDITEISVVLNGIISIVSDTCDIPENSDQGFVYSIEPEPTIEDNVVSVSGVTISSYVDSLQPNTTYYVRSFLTNSLGVFYANEISFTTNEDVCTIQEVDDLHNDVDCYASNTGSFTIEISNCNTAPFDIVVLDLNGVTLIQDQVSNTSYTANNLLAGEYVVTVQDENENSYTLNVTITEPSPIEITVNINVDTATINVSGGIPPYNYVWSNGVEGNTANNLEDGNYTVTVYDSNDCSQEVEFEIYNDVDQDGFSPADGDCDDHNSAIYPGAEEVCDGIDNDCDASIDEGCNNPPYLNSAVISPATPNSTSVLTCQPGSFGDPDGDTVTFTFQWMVNGNPIDQNEQSLTPNFFSVGDTVNCIVTPFDGVDYGAPIFSNSVTISN